MADLPRVGPAPRGGAGDDGDAGRGLAGQEPVTRLGPAGTAAPRAGPAAPAGGDAGEATRTFPGRDAVTRSGIGEPGRPSGQRPPEPVRRGPAAGVVRYGPGVPAPSAGGPAGPGAERVWRAGRLPAPGRRGPGLGRLLSSALTVVLLAASGLLLYARFHHAALQVTGVVISRPAPITCGGEVTGRIATNGAAGTVSYQWLVRPGQRGEKLPGRGSASVAAGQRALPVVLYLPVVRGRGRASELVTLQVLEPGFRTASATVAVSC